MVVKSLNESYSVCGKAFEIFSKSGEFLGLNGTGDYNFIQKTLDGSVFFTITSDLDLEKDVGIKVKDRTSIGLFGKKGSMFMVYNHRNSKYSYYPIAVKDLFWHLEKGWLKDIMNKKRLDSASKSFPQSKTFLQVLKKMKHR